MTRGEGASTEGMKGEGYYDLHSEYQRRIIEGGDELIRSAVAELDLGSVGSALTVADYGCGTGASSVHAVGTAIAAIRERDRELPVLAIHNDVPTNDFTQVFANVAGEDGYLDTPGAAIYASAAAGSFFTQVVPDASVHLGSCSNAAHWFREQRPQPIATAMYFCDAAGEAREALAAGAAQDWDSFLAARAAELAPGGIFLVQGIGTVPGDGGEQVSASKLLSAMWQAADELAEQGTLDRGVLDTYVFPVYCRSPEELAAPAQGGPLAEKLEVVSVTVEEVPDPYWEVYERDGDPAAYAEVYTQFVRAFAESTLTTNLFAPGAVSSSPEELRDDYFGRLERRVAEDPAAGRYEAWVVRALFRRLS